MLLPQKVPNRFIFDVVLLFASISIILFLYIALWAYILTGDWRNVSLINDVPYAIKGIIEFFIIALVWKYLHPLKGSVSLATGFLMLGLLSLLVMPIEKFSLLHPEVLGIYATYMLFPILTLVGCALIIQGYYVIQTAKPLEKRIQL